MNVLKNKYKIRKFEAFTNKYRDGSDYDYTNTKFSETGLWISLGTVYKYELAFSPEGLEKYFVYERGSQYKIIAFDGFIAEFTIESGRINHPNEIVVSRVMELLEPMLMISSFSLKKQNIS